MSLTPATDTSPADWFVGADGPWYVTATYGPPGLAAYARVSLEREGEDFAFPTSDPADNDRVLSSVLATLSDHTSTPDVVHVAFWDGWDGFTPDGVRISIPSRGYVLMTGALMDACNPTWLGISPGTPELPSLIWPDDRAWFVCWDTDEMWNFSVGGSSQAITDLADSGDVQAEIVPYGTPEDGWTW